MEYTNQSAGAKIVEEEEGEEGNMVIKDISKSEDLWMRIRNPVYYKIDILSYLGIYRGTHFPSILLQTTTPWVVCWSERE